VISGPLRDPSLRSGWHRKDARCGRYIRRAITPEVSSRLLGS